MADIKTPAAQRLRETIDYAKKTPTAFAMWIGFSQPGIVAVLQGRNKRISSELAEKITTVMLDLNPEWLLWGRGAMLRTQNLQKKYEGAEDVVRVLGESGEVYETWAAGVERRLAALEAAVARLGEG